MTPPSASSYWRCKILTDRVKTAAAARTTAVPIRLDVLSEFSEPGNSVCEDLLNANVSELISGVQAWLLGRERGNQLWQLHNIEDAPEIIGERGQAELAAYLLQSSHQKRPLVHPLLDRAKRVFDGLTAVVEDVRALRYAGLHAVQYRLVLETGYGAELIARALRADRAVAAGLAVAVIDLLQAAHPRRRIGMKTLTRWAEKAVAGWVVAELIFAE